MSTNGTKTIKGRISNKHGTEAEWLQADAAGFKPLPGELIIYDPDDSYDYFRFKFGDKDSDEAKRRTVNNLPFVGEAERIRLEELFGAVVSLNQTVDDLKDIVEELEVSGGVQSDFDETDPFAASYIKNKPFGEDSELEKEGDLDTNLIEANASGQYFKLGFLFNHTTNPDPDLLRFKVRVYGYADPQEYSSYGLYLKDFEKTSISGGYKYSHKDKNYGINVYVFQVTDYVAFNSSHNARLTKNGYYGCEFVEPGTCSDLPYDDTISIVESYELYKIVTKQIDTGYIPNTIARTSDIPTKNSWNYDDQYVKYNAAQSLTDDEKAQARNNIGAGTSSFSGIYNDLTNKPTIPTVNNGKLTIQKNGTEVATFTANQSGDATANIVVPTKVSELTNDSGFKTVDTTYDVATTTTLGLVKSSTTGTTANRNYAVEVNSDGTMKVNVPWVNTQDGNDNQTVKAGAVTFGANDPIDFVAGNNVTVTGNKTEKKITIGLTNVATLDENGHVPSTQLPSYVDDVIEGYISNNKNAFYSDEAKTETIPAETGKIYLDIPSLKTYRWGGSTYAEISESLALGETATTAYYGDKGKVAYDHSQSSHAPSDAEKNVQSDWNETDTTSDAYIKNKPVIDNALSTTSENAVQNKIVTAALSGKASLDEGLFYVEGKGTVAGTWTGSNDRITEYYDGLTILYKINIAGASTTTLNINELGAKTVYRYGTAKVTSHYPVNSVIVVAYMANINSGCWMVLGDYDSTNVDSLRPNYARFYTADALYSYKICGVDKDGKLRPLTTTNGTGTTKAVNTAAIKPTEFYYYNATTTINANSLVGAQTLYTSYSYTTFQYTFNSTGTAYREIYLKGTFDATTNLFTLDTTSATSWYVLVPYNSTLSLTNYFTKGKDYILIGRTYSTDNYFALYENHSLYRFNGTNLKNLSFVDTDTTYELLTPKNAQNNSVYVELTPDNSDQGSGFSIKGTGGTSVTTNASGTVVITSPTVPTVNDGTLTLKASNGLEVTEKTFTANDADNVTFEVKHADTSSVEDLDANGRTYVTSLSFDEYGHVTGYDVGTESDQDLTHNHDGQYKKLQNSYSKEFSGAYVVKKITQDEQGVIFVEDRELTAADLGLTKIMNFLGTSTTAIAQDSTTNPITIDGASVTALKGDVALYGTKEFVWEGSKWKELGDQGSHALKTISITGTDGLTGGGTLEANREIKHAVPTGASASTTSGSKVTGITTDKFGHVTGVTTGEDIDTNTAHTHSAGTGIVLEGAGGIDGDTKISHANSGVTAGTYESVTVNAQGHVTAGTNPTKYWANVAVSGSSNDNTSPTFNPGFKVKVANNTAYTPAADWAWASPIPNYLWHDLIAFKTATFEQSTDGETWTASTNENYTKGPTNKKENQTIEAVNSTKKFARWTWTGGWHACQAQWLVIGFTYQAAAAKCNIKLESYNTPDTSTTARSWTTNLNVTHTGQSAPVWFKLNPDWSNTDRIRLTIEWASDATHNSKGVEYKSSISQVKFLTARWGNQGFGSELEYPYEWNNNQDIYPRAAKTSNLGSSSREWANVYTNNLQATTINGVTVGSSPKFTDTNTAHSHAAGVGLLLNDTNTGGVNGTVTYKAALVNETKSSNAATYTAGGTSKFYAVQLDKDGKLSVAVPWQNNTNDNQTIKGNGTAFGANDSIDIVGDGDVTITADITDAANKKIKISYSTPANNVTGSGTNGKLVKWSGPNTVTDGPEFGTDATKFLNNKGEWAAPPAGTVTSIGITVPTGLTVTNSPITTSGTIAITLANGYSIPTTAKQSNWDAAYGWGNHASAGYVDKTTEQEITAKKTFAATGSNQKVELTNTQVRLYNGANGFNLKYDSGKKALKFVFE